MHSFSSLSCLRSGAQLPKVNYMWNCDPGWTISAIRRIRFYAVVAIAIGLRCAPAVAQQTPGDALQPILQYISATWGTLTRSETDCKIVSNANEQTKAVLYFPAKVPIPPQAQAVERTCAVRIERLPMELHHLGEIDPAKITPQALLYVPNPYVVPGGMFNEMYGWDSYFIILGLLRENRLPLARGMVDNFFYEIEHYGAVLNANRGYFLTRSQPPFLTSMILAVHEAQTTDGHDDRAWLTRAYEYAVRDHQMWTRDPHLAAATGLSRYFDFGQGPVPEITVPHDSYYSDVARELGRRPDHGWLTAAASSTTPPDWPRFALYICPQSASPDQSCPAAATIAFTPDYYKGDRSMRESGFDVTFRFGPFGAATHHFAPVCLNSLLYKTERDLATLSRALGRNNDAARWTKRAQARRAAINKYLWDERSGMFFDYDVERGVRSAYLYATTFYPLWTGLATDRQARAVVANLKRFEQQGGVAMSEQITGVQWDLPYGWAPIELLTAEGLRNYGYNEDADRISAKFLTTVLENFRRDGTIREKYNVVTGSSETTVTAGYKTNMIGFGWTNGVFLQLLHELPPQWRDRLRQKAAPAPERNSRVPRRESP